MLVRCAWKHNIHAWQHMWEISFSMLKKMTKEKRDSQFFLMINAWNEDKYVQEIIFVLFKMKQQFIIRFFWMVFFSHPRYIGSLRKMIEDSWTIRFHFFLVFSESYYFRKIFKALLIAKKNKKSKQMWKRMILMNENGFRHGFCHSHSFSNLLFTRQAFCGRHFI